MRRSTTVWRTPRRHSCAERWRRLAHEAGLCVDVASAGELHCALSAGVPAGRLVLHGNYKSDRGARRRPRGGRRAHRRRRRRRPRPSGATRCRPLRAPAHPLAGDARRRGAHPRVRAHRTRGHQVRGVDRLRRGDPAARESRATPTGSRSSAYTRTSAARSSTLARSPRRLRSSPSTSRRSSSKSSASAGAWASPTSPASRHPTIAEWGRAVRAAVPRRGRAEPRAGHRRAGRSIVAAAGRHALHGRRDQGARGRPHLRRRRRRHERQPAPGPLRLGLRGVPATGGRRRAAAARSGSSASTARAATCSSTTHAFPPTCASATCCARR